MSITTSGRRSPSLGLLMWFSIFARAILGVSFVLAGFAKFSLVDASMSPTSVYSRLIPNGVTASRLIPVLEIIFGCVLILGIVRRIAILLAIALLSAFSTMIFLELRRDDPLPCGCFGPKEVSLDPSKTRATLAVSLGRNIALIAIGGVTLFIPTRQLSQ
jgi:hypothetical protein